MNTISASTPPVRHRQTLSIKQVAHKLGVLIAPRDHAGKGNWSYDADVPWWAWPGALAFTAFFIFGPQILCWLLRAVA